MENKFTDYNFQDYIYEALKEINFEKPTEVQTEVIPQAKKGKDLIVQSETGSGKTHAFLLPIFDKVKKGKAPKVVITTPSRELAYQIYDDAKQIAKHSPDDLKVSIYVGGTDKQRQEHKLENSQPDIAIGTPGRLWDMVKNNYLDVSEVETLVIDEADMTMDMGFLDDVDKIASSMPEDLQIMVFSATIPEKLQPFLKKYLSDPKVIKVNRSSLANPNVENWLISARGKDKKDLLYNVLQSQNPYLALIFANTKEDVDDIYYYLLHKGFNVARIHGGLTPRERKRVMKQINRLEYQYVVASDLAARGIDIPGISHVVNYEIPENLEFFIHRIGRTGRNNMKGISITLYMPSEENKVNQLESLGVKFKNKTLKNGEVIDTHDRDRREKRTASHEKLNTKLVGMVKKEKIKKKPGYRKKIKKSIQDEQRKQRKINQRADRKQERNRNRSKSNY